MTGQLQIDAFEGSTYAEIEADVRATAQGRWFLGQHAARNRHADTQTVLAAIEQLRETVAPRVATLRTVARPEAAPGTVHQLMHRLQNAIEKPQGKLPADVDGDHFAAITMLSPIERLRMFY